MDKLISVDEVSELLSIKPMTIYKWVHIGYIPHVKLGRCVRFRKSDIENWVNDKVNLGRKQRIPSVDIDT